MGDMNHREFVKFGPGRGPVESESDRGRRFRHDRRGFDPSAEGPVWAHRHPRRHGGPRGFGPGFGPGFDRQFGRGRGRGGRGRRGDVRSAVLLLLEERPMHGYELIQEIRKRSDDVWRPSPGSIYPALSQLEDEGLIVIEKVSGRKTARLTEEGSAHIAEHRADLGDPWAEVRSDVGAQAIDLRELVAQVMEAAGHVVRAGTPEQAERAAQVLTDTRRSLYRILAEDDVRDSDPGDGSTATDVT